MSLYNGRMNRHHVVESLGSEQRKLGLQAIPGPRRRAVSELAVPGNDQSLVGQAEAGGRWIATWSSAIKPKRRPSFQQPTHQLLSYHHLDDITVRCMTPHGDDVHGHESTGSSNPAWFRNLVANPNLFAKIGADTVGYMA